MSAPDPTTVPRVLPRGRHAVSRDVVLQSQRERLLEAIAAAVAEKGYGNTSVADVIDRAGVSRKTFYEHFANKEACFLAAYDAGTDAMLASIEAKVRGAAPAWLDGAIAGTRCYLEILASNPEFARTFLVEVLAAGPDALEHRARILDRFARLLEDVQTAARRDLPELPHVGPHVFRACVGAINELVTAELLRGRVDRLPDLLSDVMDVEVGLLIGREVAARMGRP